METNSGIWRTPLELGLGWGWGWGVPWPVVENGIPVPRTLLVVLQWKSTCICYGAPCTDSPGGSPWLQRSGHSALFIEPLCGGHSLFLRLICFNNGRNSESPWVGGYAERTKAKTKLFTYKSGSPIFISRAVLQASGTTVAAALSDPS